MAPTALRLSLVLLTVLLGSSLVARAGTQDRHHDPGYLQLAGGDEDPCRFYRSQAWRQGLMHFSQDMLWSCEAIAERRRAGIRLSDRLIAAEAALEAYRTGVINFARARYQRSRDLGLDTFSRRVTEQEKREIAQSSGAFAAIEALAGGY